MSNVRVYVGLDYHQDSVQVCVLSPSGKVLGNRACPNDEKHIIKWVASFGGRIQAAIESCNGAADLAEALVSQGEWSVDMAHPGYVSRMKQNPDKTDMQDAHLLADLERVGYLPRVWLAPKEVRELRRLVRFRQQLANLRRTTKLRIGALLREQRLRPPAGVNAWTKKWEAWVEAEEELSEESQWIIEQQLKALRNLKERIKEVEDRLEAKTANDKMVQHLLEQKGVGKVTAWTIRAEIGRFDRFRSGKQLSKFCGLSPRNASSGQRQADAGLIKTANRELRAVLIEAAHRLVRYDEKWKAVAQRLRKAGKPGSVTVAAVANRWTRGLYHTMQKAAA